VIKHEADVPDRKPEDLQPQMRVGRSSAIIGFAPALNLPNQLKKKAGKIARQLGELREI